MIGNWLTCAAGNEKMPASRLCRLWRIHHGVNVSRQTVNRRLLQRGYRARRMTKCPRLTVRHRVARLQWARRHRRWQLGHWRHVIFTDESRYILDRQDGRQRVRRLRGENLRDDCVRETNQWGGGSVMVWAGITLWRKNAIDCTGRKRQRRRLPWHPGDPVSSICKKGIWK